MKKENEEIWKELEGKAKSVTTKVKKKIIPWKIGKKVWHSEKWKEIKKRTKKIAKNNKKERNEQRRYTKKRSEQTQVRKREGERGEGDRGKKGEEGEIRGYRGGGYEKEELGNYVVNKERMKKKGKVYAFFVDLKEAFDKVDRRELGEMLKKTGIKEQLRRRIMETYKETRGIIKVGNRKTED